MTLLRTGSTVIVCALALGFVAPRASAQQPTAAEEAAYQEFLKTCSSEITAMKKVVASKGETATDAELRGFFLQIFGELRDMAKREGMTFAAVLREARSRMTTAMNDPNNPDESDRVIGPPAVCFLDMLTRRETGEAASPRTPAPGPASPRPSAPEAADPMGGAPSNCVRLNEDGKSGFRNTCDFPVNFTYCAYRPAPRSNAQAFDCERGWFGASGIAAKGTVAGFTRNVEMSYWFDCPKPKAPIGSKFVAGRGIVSTCK